MSDARAARDLLDVKKLSVWLKNHNPFDENDPRLKSLSSGKVSETKITCEIAEDIGKKIHKLIDNKKLYEVKIKRKDMIQCLDSESNKVQVETKQLIINPSVLFTRLSALAGCKDNSLEYFDYEMLTYLMSFFKDGLMMKPERAVVRNLILTQRTESVEIGCHIVDGELCSTRSIGNQILCI